MGSPESDKDADLEEKPQHRVRITKPFYLGKYEVTRGEFRKFVTATKYITDAEREDDDGLIVAGVAPKPRRTRPKPIWNNPLIEQTDSHPVVWVSWNDATSFCQWLSKQEGETYRLPTEAEWEWACRAGTIERWSSGNKKEDLQANVNISDAFVKERKGPWHVQWKEGEYFTSVVGKYRANQFGLHDMHGNVWEWCQDWYDEKYYQNSPIDDPRGPTKGSDRMERAIRGGGWYFRPECSRSASRFGSRQTYKTYDLGFRVARDR